MTLRKNGCLGAWWVKIWIEAGREPSCAEECLDLSQNIIHLSGEQSLTADSLSEFHSFCRNGRKCYQTCNLTDGLFSAVLMRHNLHVADSSYFQWNESYNHTLSLASHLLLMPCWEGKPNGQHFFSEISSNTDSVQN